MPASDGSLATNTLIELLDLFSAGEAVPGGGAAAATGGALGTSLLLMVARLPKTRTGAAEEAEHLRAAAAALTPLRERLVALADEDADAYFAVMSAYGLPKGTETDKASRRARIEAAMERATAVPLEMMRVCQQVLREATPVATHGVGSARGEVLVALELLMAALRGSAACVDANLAAVKDEGYIGRVAPERRQLEADATSESDRIRAVLAV